MRVSIAHLRAAGLSAEQIIKVVEEADAERREQNRIRQQKHRSGHTSGVIGVTEKVPIEEKKVSKKVRKRSIGADWLPSSEDRDFAKGEGWSDERIDREILRFRNYYLASGKTMQTWSPKWQNWVISPIQNGGQGGALHVRTSGQQASGLTEAFAKVRGWVRDQQGGTADGVLSQDRLPKPRSVHSDVGGNLGGISTGDRGVCDRSENGAAAPMQVAADTGRSGGSVRSGDWVSDEGRPELRIVASTETAPAKIQRR